MYDRYISFRLVPFGFWSAIWDFQSEKQLKLGENRSIDDEVNYWQGVRGKVKVRGFSVETRRV